MRLTRSRTTTGSGDRPSVDAAVGDGLGAYWPPSDGGAAYRSVPQPNRQHLATSRATAAVTAVRRIYAGLMASATVNGPQWATGAITGSVLDMMTTDLVLNGETTWHITSTQTGAVRLDHLPRPTITGKTLDGSDWWVTAYAAAPSGQVTVKAAWRDVLHIVHQPAPYAPWRGQSLVPAAEGRVAWTSAMAASDRLAGPHGIFQVLKLDQEYPMEGGRALVRQLAQRQAHRQYGEMTPTVQDRRWTQELQEYGKYHNSVIEAVDASQAAAIAIRDAAGIPAAMMPGETVHQSGATREALSVFVLTGLKPLARLITDEVSRKLGTQVTLDLSHLRNAESAGMARAVKALTASGMPLPEALAVVGYNE